MSCFSYESDRDSAASSRPARSRLMLTRHERRRRRRREPHGLSDPRRRRRRESHGLLRTAMWRRRDPRGFSTRGLRAFVQTTDALVTRGARGRSRFGQRVVRGFVRGSLRRGLRRTARRGQAGVPADGLGQSVLLALVVIVPKCVFYSEAAVVPEASDGLDQISTSRPRRRRDASPWNVHVADVAARLHGYPRPGRGVAATRPRNVHVEYPRRTRLRGISTSWPRRRRDSSED